jgi:Flp pilus assembly protein TadB
MVLGVMTGLLTALVALPIASRVRPASRGRSSRGSGRLARHLVPDYASLLDRIARQVRSGSSLTSAALDEIDPGTPLHRVVDRLNDGSSLVDALAAAVTPDPDLAVTVQALSATAHLGGPIAATLDEAAAVVRDRAAARAERQAHGSQARLSARLLTVVPVVFAAWSAIANQRTRDVYISTAAGGVSAAVGLTLNVAGWRWMKRIIGPS